MKTLCSLLLALFCFNLEAVTLTTKIAKIIPAEGPDRPELYFFENGRVGRLSENKSFLLRADLKSAFRENSLLHLHLNEGMIKEMEILTEEARPSFSEDPLPSFESYRPTQLQSYGEAQDIFSKLNRGHQRDSQCYNRAHVWAYEEWRRIGLRSLKLFMFFTTRYIWDYKYEWWFHVTPLTYVGNIPYTLDRTFNRAPLNIKDWTLGFIKSRRDCVVVSRYSQYERNQMTEHCYLIPATMHFWQPRDLESYEQTGRYKNSFIPSEVNHSYWEAF